MSERSKAQAKADKYFSLFIRLKNADKNGNCKCATCGKLYHWKNIDCGHFMTRDQQATRYEEKNVAPQCASCNRFKGGRQVEMGKYLDLKHGEGTADEMLFKSKMYCKRDRYDLQVLADHFRIAFNKLKND